MTGSITQSKKQHSEDTSNFTIYTSYSYIKKKYTQKEKICEYIYSIVTHIMNTYIKKFITLIRKYD